MLTRQAIRYSPEAKFAGRLISETVFAENITSALNDNDKFINFTAESGIAGLAERTNRVLLNAKLSEIFESRRRCIFALPHWGNYVQTFIEIGLCSNQNEFVAIRGNLWNNNELRMYELVNRSNYCSIDIARTDKNGLIRFVKGVNGKKYGLTCYDLDYEYGQTMPIRMFNHVFHLAFKWIDISYRSNALICFVKPVSINDEKADVLKVLDPRSSISIFDFRRMALAESVGCLEYMIREYPWNWFMWNRIDKYLKLDSSAREKI